VVDLISRPRRAGYGSGRPTQQHHQKAHHAHPQ
jgi:hypothetical protein